MKRYSLRWSVKEGEVLVEDSSGAWVKYEDAVAEVERARGSRVRIITCPECKWRFVPTRLDFPTTDCPKCGQGDITIPEEY